MVMCRIINLNLLRKIGEIFMMTMIVSIVFTIIVLILSLLTITKGYGYKHTIDPISEDEEHHEESHGKNK